jgi:methanethiol oxidase
VGLAEHLPGRLRPGARGRRPLRPLIHIWDLDRRQVVQDIDLGEEGMIPLEIRWLHRPDADEGFVGAALSSTMWHVRRGEDGRFAATKVIESPTRELEGSRSRCRG